MHTWPKYRKCRQTSGQMQRLQVCVLGQTHKITDTSTFNIEFYWILLLLLFSPEIPLFPYHSCASSVCPCFDSIRQNKQSLIMYFGKKNSVLLAFEQPRVWAALPRPCHHCVTLAAALGCALSSVIECGSGKTLPFAFPGSASRTNGATDHSYRELTGALTTRYGRSVTGMRCGLWHRVSKSSNLSAANENRRETRVHWRSCTDNILLLNGCFPLISCCLDFAILDFSSSEMRDNCHEISYLSMKCYSSWLCDAEHTDARNGETRRFNAHITCYFAEQTA